MSDASSSGVISKKAIKEYDELNLESSEHDLKGGVKEICRCLEIQFD